MSESDAARRERLEAERRDRAFFGHPAGLSTLFFTEMWERFSYYGMRAFLIFYMIAESDKGGLGLSKTTAGLILGVYTSSVYLLSLPGGWIADRFLGQRKAVTYGGVGIMLGNILLAMPNNGLFYAGLALAALGTGLLKPNVSTIVGQLYSQADPRRDAGYTIYYMGINIGAFFAPFACGFLAQTETFQKFLVRNGLDPYLCWKFAFGAVAFGMAAGLVQYILGQGKLGKAGLEPTIPSDVRKAERDRNVLKGILGGLGGIALLAFVFQDRITETFIGTVFPIMLAIIAIALFVGLFMSARDAGEKKRVIAMLPLFLGAIAFFGIFEQASSTLNLFADENTSRELLGVSIPASYYQSVNSVFIIVLAPVFAWLWIALNRARKEPSDVNKFGIGMLFITASFVIMLPTLSAEAHGEKVSGLYLIALYFFYTCSELCISPVGLSSMSRLAPPRLAGMVMGTWFLGTSIGNFIAGQAAGVTEKRGHSFLFWSIIISSLIVAAALMAVAPLIKRMMGGKDHSETPSDKSEKAEPEPLPTARVVAEGKD
jgi:proton-dependent oligopeptide transporter, POT family